MKSNCICDYCKKREKGCTECFDNEYDDFEGIEVFTKEEIQKELVKNFPFLDDTK